MKKTIGKVGTTSGLINATKLCSEIENKGIKDFIMEIQPETDEVMITSEENWDDILIAVNAHDPSPLPIPKTEMELLKEQVEMQDSVINELVFTIIPELQVNQ